MIFKKNKTKLTKQSGAWTSAAIKNKPAFPSYEAVENFTARAALYENLKDGVPVIAGCVSKIVRLTGGFAIECGDKGLQNDVNAFLEKVPLGNGMTGISQFISCFLECLLTAGTAAGEAVLSKNLDSFTLYNISPKEFTLERNEDPPYNILIRNSENRAFPVNESPNIFLASLDPEPGRLYGSSLLKGLPFIGSVLMRIFKSTGENWERFGNLRYAVTYRPQNDALDRNTAKDRADMIAKGWSDVMNSSDTRDFVAVGDVDVKVIGADSKDLDGEVPVRQMIEEILAKTGVPPFLLGFNWSTSERMAKEQSDMLTSELTHYRRILTPVITKIADLYIRTLGERENVKVVWDDITLLDKTEEARAKLLLAQAQKALRD